MDRWRHAMYVGTGRDEQCRKTSIDNTRRCRQDLIGREGYTKGASEQCRKTAIDNTRGSRQRGEGSVTSRYAGMDRDEQCRKTAIDTARRCREDLIGRVGYTKGAREQCRKMSIDNTRSRRQDVIGLRGLYRRDDWTMPENVHRKCTWIPTMDRRIGDVTLYRNGPWLTTSENVHSQYTWVPTTGEGSVTSRYAGTDRDKKRRKNGHSQYTVQPTRFYWSAEVNIQYFRLGFGDAKKKTCPTDGITIALYSYTQPGQYFKSILSSFWGYGF